jgi:hypothetical protein
MVQERFHMRGLAGDQPAAQAGLVVRIRQQKPTRLADLTSGAVQRTLRSRHGYLPGILLPYLVHTTSVVGPAPVNTPHFLSVWGLEPGPEETH